MENLELEPGFYNKRGYGEFEKHYLHHATVSVLILIFIIVKLYILIILFNKNINNIFFSN